MRYIVIVNKYSHAGSGYTRRDIETDSMYDAIKRADRVVGVQRFAHVVDTVADKTVYVALKAEVR